MRKHTIPELLSATIQELMQHRALDEITVKDLLEECGISRPAFYKYFRDKHELLEYVFRKELAEPYFWDITKDLKQREILFLYHLRKNRTFYLNALKSTGQNSFYHLWLDQAVHSVLHYFRSLPEYGNLSDDDLSFYARYLSLAYVNMNIEWLISSHPLIPEEMAEKLELIMQYGMNGLKETGTGDGSSFHSPEQAAVP